MADWEYLASIPATHGNDPGVGAIGALRENSFLGVGRRLLIVGGTDSNAATLLDLDNGGAILSENALSKPMEISAPGAASDSSSMLVIDPEREGDAGPGVTNVYWDNVSGDVNFWAPPTPVTLEAGAEVASSSIDASTSPPNNILVANNHSFYVWHRSNGNIFRSYDTHNDSMPVGAPVYATKMHVVGDRLAPQAYPSWFILSYEEPPGEDPRIRLTLTERGIYYTPLPPPPVFGPIVTAGESLYLLDVPNKLIYGIDVATAEWSVWGALPHADSDPISYTPLFAGSDDALIIEVATANGRALFTHPAQAEGPQDGLVSIPAVAEISMNIAGRQELTQATVLVSMDVDGPQVDTVEALIAFHTGRTDTVEAVIQLDVNAPLPSQPRPIVAPDLDAVIPSTGVLPERRRIEQCEADNYSLSWRAGGQLVGSASALAARGAPTLSHLFAVESSLPGLEWEAAGEVRTVVDYQPDTLNLVQNELLPELMPVEDIRAISIQPDDTDCPSDDDATLCDESTTDSMCAAREALRDLILPTRLSLAREALSQVGVSLVILGGMDAIPGAERRVNEDYRTQGMTPMDVVSDMLLAANPYTWFAPEVMFIYGGSLPSGSMSIPAGCMSGSISSQALFRQAPPMPLLSDYLKECGELGDCNSFELSQDATLESEVWREDERGITRTTDTVVKSGGQITRKEELVERVAAPIWGRLTIEQAIAGNHRLTPLSHSLTLYEYLPCCPEAMLQSETVTRASISIVDYSSGGGGGIPVGRGSLDLGVDRVVGEEKVVNDWHAEGWLRGRVTTAYRETGITKEYELITEDTELEERWRPVGNGMWLYSWRKTTTGLFPVYSESDSGGGVGGVPIGGMPDPADISIRLTPSSLMVRSTSETGSSITDEPPPQVRCQDDTLDPCRPEMTCQDLMTERYQQDHAEWEELVAALEATTPEVLLEMNLNYEGIRRDIIPGHIHEGWLVTGVSYSASGPVGGRPSQSTSVTLVSAGA